MYRANHGIYTIITSVLPGILINLFQCPIPLMAHTRTRTPAEPIRTWHTGTIIQTRE